MVTNTKPALKHGTRSPDIVNPIANQLADDVIQRRPDLTRYPEAVAAWAALEAKAFLLRNFIDEVGMFAGNRLRPAVGLLLRFEEASRRARKELGLSPTAEIELEKLKRETLIAGTSLDSLRDIGRTSRNQP